MTMVVDALLNKKAQREELVKKTLKASLELNPWLRPYIDQNIGPIVQNLHKVFEAEYQNLHNELKGNYDNLAQTAKDNYTALAKRINLTAEEEANKRVIEAQRAYIQKVKEVEATYIKKFNEFEARVGEEKQKERVELEAEYNKKFNQLLVEESNERIHNERGYKEKIEKLQNQLVEADKLFKVEKALHAEVEGDLRKNLEALKKERAAFEKDNKALLEEVEEYDRILAANRELIKKLQKDKEDLIVKLTEQPKPQEVKVEKEQENKVEEVKAPEPQETAKKEESVPEGAPKKGNGFLLALALGILLSGVGHLVATNAPAVYEWFTNEHTFSEASQAVMSLLDNTDEWTVTGSSRITHKNGVTISNVDSSYNSHVHVYFMETNQTKLFADDIGYIRAKALKVRDALWAKTKAVSDKNTEDKEAVLLKTLLKN